MAQEVAVTKCPWCRRYNPLFWSGNNRLYLCNCGRGTLRDVPDAKIKWVPKNRAGLALALIGTASNPDYYVTREVITA